MHGVRICMIWHSVFSSDIMGDIIISRAHSAEPSENLSKLFSELNGYETVPDISRINSLIASGRLAFYIVTDNGKPVAMASVIPCRTAACDKLWIEDVCVLSEYRGRGLGKTMMEFVIRDSISLFGGGTFWLTSRPSRQVARHMYASLGFTERETGVFTLKI